MTLVERLSKVEIILNIHHRTAECVNTHLDQWLAKIPRHLFKSITFDNGKEFAEWREIANKYDISTYFAEVGAPNQRGLNENNNGIIRRDGLNQYHYQRLWFPVNKIDNLNRDFFVPRI